MVGDEQAEQVKIRQPRRNVLFRDTARYCNAGTHCRNEQDRPDGEARSDKKISMADLWSLLYVLVEMKQPLPWACIR